MAIWYGTEAARGLYPFGPVCRGTMRVIADIIDPDIIQKILDHVEAQPPPTKSTATASHYLTRPGLAKPTPARPEYLLSDQPNRL